MPGAPMASLAARLGPRRKRSALYSEQSLRALADI